MSRRTASSARFLAVILSGYVAVDVAVRAPLKDATHSKGVLPKSKMEMPSQNLKDIDQPIQELRGTHNDELLPKSKRKKLSSLNVSKVLWHIHVHVSQLASFVLGHHTSIVMATELESYELVFFAPSPNRTKSPGGLLVQKFEANSYARSHDNNALQWYRSWSYGTTEKTPLEVQNAMRPYFAPLSYDLCQKNCNVFTTLGLLYATGSNKDWRSAEYLLKFSKMLPSCMKPPREPKAWRRRQDFDMDLVKNQISRPVKIGDLVFYQTDADAVDHTFQYVAKREDINGFMRKGVKVVEPAKHFRAGDSIYVHCFDNEELKQCQNGDQTYNLFYDTVEAYLPCHIRTITESHVHLAGCGFRSTGEVDEYTIDIGKMITRKEGASLDASGTINIFHYDASPVKSLGWTA
eukprot:TRINITY_DN23867_c0_g1_i1.p1 TRINITY_DN23867_c0_g1~~TRINITY_DN23867_c0_g1_i1.p1  ORF type:complete len:406 (+),score=43.42 TRINITY_DN23867_c0_g1_i1:54-1271(+)